MDHTHPHHSDPPSFWRSPAGLAWAVAITVGGFYLLAEHRAHLFGVLSYLLILACPLMHVFMHKGHHHGGGRPSNESRRSQDEQP